MNIPFVDLKAQYKSLKNEISHLILPGEADDYYDV